MQLSWVWMLCGVRPTSNRLNSRTLGSDRAGVSGIGIGPIDGDEVREALQKADRSGIKIVCLIPIFQVNKSGFIGL